MIGPDAPGAYAAENPIRFSTKYFDAETGLGYWGYRYYSPGLGRWISRDPLGELGGLNLYGYCSGRPMFFYDPLGLLEWYEGWLHTAGALVGVTGSNLGGGVGYTLGHGLSVTGSRAANTVESLADGIQAGSDTLVAAVALQVGYLDGESAVRMSPLAQAVEAAEGAAIELQNVGVEATAANLLVGSAANAFVDHYSELGAGIASGDPMAISEATYELAVVAGSTAAQIGVTRALGGAAKGAGLLDDVAGLTDDAAKVGGGLADDLAKPLHRPYLRKSTKEAIFDAAARTRDGKFIDPNTGKVIDGKYHIGHRTRFEHRKLVAEARRRGMTQKEFNDWVNDHPEWFQIEDPVSNMSHRFEDCP